MPEEGGGRVHSRVSTAGVPVGAVDRVLSCDGWTYVRLRKLMRCCVAKVDCVQNDVV